MTRGLVAVVPVQSSAEGGGSTVRVTFGDVHVGPFRGPG